MIHELLEIYFLIKLLGFRYGSEYQNIKSEYLIFQVSTKTLKMSTKTLKMRIYIKKYYLNTNLKENEEITMENQIEEIEKKISNIEEILQRIFNEIKESQEGIINENK